MILTRFGGGGVIIGTKEQIERQFKKRVPMMNPDGGRVVFETDFKGGGKYERVYLTSTDAENYLEDDRRGFFAIRDYFLSTFLSSSRQDSFQPHVESGQSYKTEEPMERYTCRDSYD